MSTAQQGNFDFSTFNAITDRIPAGLQIFLAQQLLSNAAWQLARFDNPRSETAVELMNDCKALRAMMKDDATARTMKDATARAKKDAEVVAEARTMMGNLAKK